MRDLSDGGGRRKTKDRFLLNRYMMSKNLKLETTYQASCEIKLIIDPLPICHYFAKQFDCGETILASNRALASAVGNIY
jgi:hypothetical protein